jgi:hypothetical protein
MHFLFWFFPINSEARGGSAWLGPPPVVAHTVLFSHLLLGFPNCFPSKLLSTFIVSYPSHRARCCSGNGLDLYSRGVRFESLPRHLLSSLRSSVVFSSPSMQMSDASSRSRQFPATLGERGSVVGWGTIIQAGRSGVRFLLGYEAV